MPATKYVKSKRKSFNLLELKINYKIIKLNILFLGVGKAAHELTAQDCLDISDIAQANRRYVRMKEWIEEAQRIFEDPTERHRVGNVTHAEIYEYLAWVNYLVCII